jgi:hypothetical protein
VLNAFSQLGDSPRDRQGTDFIEMQVKDAAPPEILSTLFGSKEQQAG